MAQAREALHPGQHVAHLSRAELGRGHVLQALVADLLDLVLLARVHEADPGALAQGPVEEAHLQDGAAVGVVLGVEEQGPQRRLRVALGRGQVLDDRL